MTNKIIDNWCGHKIVDIDNCYINYRAMILLNDKYKNIDGFDTIYKEYLRQIGIKNTADFKVVLNVVPMLLTRFVYDAKNKKIMQMYKLRENLSKEDIVKLLNEYSLNEEERWDFEDMLDSYFWKSQETYSFDFKVLSEISELTYMNFYQYRHIFTDYILNSSQFKCKEMFEPMFDSINIGVKYRPLDKNSEEICMLSNGALINADDDGEDYIYINLDFREISERDWKLYY